MSSITNLKIINWIKKYFLMVELPLVSLALLAFVFEYRLLLVLFATLLGLWYFTFAQCDFYGEHKFLNIANKINAMAWSVAVLGILFQVNDYPGANLQMKVAAIAIALSLFPLSYHWYQKQDPALLSQSLIRSLILFGVLTCLWYYPVVI